jgi:ABC-type transport system involved in multi-copper enzyme maturation permease subunit
MFWTIFKRETIDHLMSLRFSAIVVLSLGLMVTSVLVFSVNYENAIKEYPSRVRELVNADGKVDLSAIPCTGGATVRRVPSPLAFCSETGERELPDQVVMAVHGLRAVQRTSEIGEILRGSAHVDWAFVISVLLSFGAGLLTYKVISGERRDGTLTLILSHPIPRSTVLLGKYFAALFALTTAFLIASLVGLIVLQSRGMVQLQGDDWVKLVLFGLVSIVYLSVFTLIGLICSVFARSPLIAAVAFLFIWIILVFVIPNAGSILAEQIGSIKTPLQMREIARAIPDQLSLTPGMTDDQVASSKLQRELVRERLLKEYLQSLIQQVHLGEDLTRVSPTSTFTYAVEQIIGGGTSRLSHFVNNAVLFREGFFQAMIQADKQDPESQHRYVPWWCGNNPFSHRVVDIGPAKEFRDSPLSSTQSLVSAFWNLFLLVLYNILAFAVAFWRFTRQDVAPTPGV